MDFALPQHVIDIQRLARDFARRDVAPFASEWSRDRIFPSDTFVRLGSLGLTGMLIPEEFGGSDAGLVTMVAVLEELGNADQSFAAALNAHTTIGVLPLVEFGTESQKQNWLTPLAQGTRLGAFGLTEPNAGSDAAAVRTRAEKRDGGWLINGSKMFISNAGTDISLGVTILATTGETNGRRRYGTFMVLDGTPGYTKGEKLKKLGWHSLDTRELVFRDCWIPDENLIGDDGNGLRQFLSVLDKGRISVAALGVSLARAALRLAVSHAKSRQQFGRPIAEFQSISHLLADMATELEAARALVYKAAWLGDCGLPFATEAAMAKLFASEVANRAASASVQIHGGYGWMQEQEIARFFADAKILEIGEGTSQVQRNIIASAVLAAT